MIHLFVLGLISILGQVVLLRELSVAFYGMELIYVLALGIWLFWTAAGATIGRQSRVPSTLGIYLLFAAFIFLLPLDLAFIRGIRRIFAAIPGAYLPFHVQMIALSIAVLPIGINLGWLFPWVARHYMLEGRSLAKAYAIESIGGLAGGIIATLFLRFGIQNFTIALACSAVSLASILIQNKGRRTALLNLLLLTAAPFLLIGWWQADTLDSNMSRWTHPQLVATRDSPYGRVTLTESGGLSALFENDAVSLTTESSAAEELTHLAAAQHPNPSRVLIMGGGIDGIVREVLKHSPRSVDYIELNPVLLQVAEAHLPEAYWKPLRSASVHVIIADPRQFLARNGAYDLILAGLPEPASGQNNRFYTAEFFRECREKLCPGGIFAFRLKSSENLWTPQVSRRTASIYQALKSAFREITVLPGSANLFIASQDPLPTDPAVLGARLQERKIEAKLVSPAYVRYLYTNDRFEDIYKILNAANTAANTDSRPICYQYTLMIWLSKFFPILAFADVPPILRPAGAHSIVWWALGIAVLALFTFARRRFLLSQVLLMGSAGFIGMVLENLLILHYQVKQGVLYQDIGILLMSFMGGLAPGATAVEGWLNGSMRARRLSMLRSATLPAAFAALAAITGFYIRIVGGATLLATAGLLAMAGFLVGGVFALTSMLGGYDQGRAVTPIYAADLAGGCLGSLTAGLFMVPFMDMAVAAFCMVPLSIASLVLLKPFLKPPDR